MKMEDQVDRVVISLTYLEAERVLCAIEDAIIRPVAGSEKKLLLRLIDLLDEYINT